LRLRLRLPLGAGSAGGGGSAGRTQGARPGGGGARPPRRREGCAGRGAAPGDPCKTPRGPSEDAPNSPAAERSQDAELGRPARDRRRRALQVRRPRQRPQRARSPGRVRATRASFPCPLALLTDTRGTRSRPLALIPQPRSLARNPLETARGVRLGLQRRFTPGRAPGSSSSRPPGWGPGLSPTLLLWRGRASSLLRFAPLPECGRMKIRPASAFEEWGCSRLWGRDSGEATPRSFRKPEEEPGEGLEPGSGAGIGSVVFSELS
ncbi:PREDICTED: translation initiation factor IF-2-like, partial [Chinchilla lanigera]|uniref:translation initiation factor IF-2-like n=1 Tax=Chinchilla lanigera TaxID=34839 RepID=UPI0006967F57